MPGKSGTEHEHADAGDAAGQFKACLCRRGEQTETGHRLVEQRRAARCGNTCQETTARQSHPLSLLVGSASATENVPASPACFDVSKSYKAGVDCPRVGRGACVIGHSGRSSRSVRSNRSNRSNDPNDPNDSEQSERSERLERSERFICRAGYF